MARQRPPRAIPPPLELDCLRELWKLGRPAAVREVQHALQPTRELAYTTVMTVLERLVNRGAASRRKSGRSFVYEAAVSREVLRRAAVNELLANFFDGSSGELMAYLHAHQPAAAAAAAAGGAPASSAAAPNTFSTPGDPAPVAASPSPAGVDQASPEAEPESPRFDPTLL
ncbi:MAG: BlaI/MecI/CopY family transcriptional regulator [bacterium]|jgi:predicted transcriptional regulator